MNCSYKYTCILTLALLILVLPFGVFSQTDTLSQAGKDHDTEAESPSPIHSLYAGVGSGSNMIYLGSTISHDQPFYSTALTYGYKGSFYTSASASHLKGVNPYLAFYSLSLNYNHVFNSWFDISADIAGYKTPESLQETLFSDFAFINFTAGFDWKLIYTKLSFGRLISVDSRGYLQVRNSRYFETPEFFNGKAQVSFDPNIDILFGELVKIETITGVTKFGASPPFRHFKKNPNSTTDSYSSEFGLMDFEFSLPVTFSYSNFSIEAEASYILPAHTNPDYPAPKGFSFFLNAYFRIF
ncbi:MAG: hypothetical protein Q7T72_04885 [Bacteroidales bacterium]|nr:hypothetical protein [Bacteroidales bacterium]MDP3001862.1 hypothetical protein [Bacteroidales bacterium]